MIEGTNRKGGPWTGNDVATTFDFDFKVFREEDIQLVRTLISTGESVVLVLDSDYTVTLNEDQNTNPGGVITYPVSGDPLSALYKLTALSVVEETQRISLPNMGPWFPKVVENALDKVTILFQQVKEQLDRTLRFSPADPAIADSELPYDRNNKYLAFDSEGRLITSLGTGADAGLREDLAAGGGAGLVRWTPPGPGGITILVRDQFSYETVKMGNYIPRDGTDTLVKAQPIFDYYSDSNKAVTFVFPQPTTAHVDGPALGILPVAGLGYRLKNSRVKFQGDGASVQFRNIAEEASLNGDTLIRMDKTLDHGGENYRDVVLEGIEIDGAGITLCNLDIKGGTRRVELRHFTSWNAVRLLRLLECYYMSTYHLELHTTVGASPTGMDPLVFAANLVALHIGTHGNRQLHTLFNMYNIGGSTLGASYDAAMLIDGSSEAVKFLVYALEGMHQTGGHGGTYGLVGPNRFIDRMLVIGGNTTVEMDTGYIEGVQAVHEVIRAHDASRFKRTGANFLNSIRAPTFLRCEKYTVGDLGDCHGDNLDIAEWVTTPDDIAHGIRQGDQTLFVGELSGNTYAPRVDVGPETLSFGASVEGIVSAAMHNMETQSTVATGVILWGYEVALDGASVVCSPGAAIVNGNHVGFGRHGGLKQGLLPSLVNETGITITYAVKIGHHGQRYCENILSPKTGSTTAPTTHLFDIPIGGGNPTNLREVAVLDRFTHSHGREAAIVEMPRETDNIAKRFGVRGGLAHNTNTPALLITMPDTPGNDDDIDVKMHYSVRTNGGASKSSESGDYNMSWSQTADDPPAGDAVMSAKEGEAPCLNSPITSMTVTMSAVTVRADGVATTTIYIKCENDGTQDSVARVRFQIDGGQRSGTQVVIPGNMGRMN